MRDRLVDAEQQDSLAPRIAAAEMEGADVDSRFAQQSADAAATAGTSTSTVPIPAQNPMAYAAPPVSTGSSGKKPFWKFWAAE